MKRLERVDERNSTKIMIPVSALFTFIDELNQTIFNDEKNKAFSPFTSVSLA